METKEEEQKMPTTYAHDFFGKRVYRRLPEKLQHLIRSNGNLYRIGQHGYPVLLFYIKESGHSVRSADARPKSQRFF